MTDEADKIAIALEASRTPGEVVRSPGLPCDGLSEITMSGVGSVTLRQPDRSAFSVGVDRLAKRLGVEPHTARDSFDALTTYVVSGEDGRAYDAFDLIHVMLDRLDAEIGK